MNASRSAGRRVLIGLTLMLAMLAIILSLLALRQPSVSTELPGNEPVTIDLSMLITGRGAIGGPALSHLFDPQLLVVRKGDLVRLRVTNASFFRHGIEVAGYGVRTGPLTGGPEASEMLTFIANLPGIFEYRCHIPYDPATATCAPDHDQMIGHLVVLDDGDR